MGLGGYSEVTTAEARMRWFAASFSMQASLKRFADAFKANFDPSQPRDEQGQWTAVGGSEISDARIRNTIIKEVAKFLARSLLKEALTGPAIGTALVLLDAASLLDEAYPYVRAYFDGPQSLEALQDAASKPAKGYEIHHIVEQTPAEQDGFPRSLIDNRENLVRVPTLKHWEINAWYQKSNEEFEGLSPRNYLRGKSWEERMRVGRRALIEAGILVP